MNEVNWRTVELGLMSMELFGFCFISIWFRSETATFAFSTFQTDRFNFRFWRPSDGGGDVVIDWTHQVLCSLSAGVIGCCLVGRACVRASIMETTLSAIDWWNASSWGNASNPSGEDHARSPPLLAEYPDALLQFAVVACILFMLVGVPGNFITILALLRYTKVSISLILFEMIRAVFSYHAGQMRTRTGQMARLQPERNTRTMCVMPQNLLLLQQCNASNYEPLAAVATVY